METVTQLARKKIIKPLNIHKSKVQVPLMISEKLTKKKKNDLSTSQLNRFAPFVLRQSLSIPSHFASFENLINGCVKFDTILFFYVEFNHSSTINFNFSNLAQTSFMDSVAPLPRSLATPGAPHKNRVIKSLLIRGARELIPSPTKIL